jgi:hypothetical protein
MSDASLDNSGAAGDATTPSGTPDDGSTVAPINRGMGTVERSCSWEESLPTSTYSAVRFRVEQPRRPARRLATSGSTMAGTSC